MSQQNQQAAPSPLKRALQAIEALQGQLDAVTQKQREPIAVIGMACRFPGGADTPEKFWQLLRNQVDAVVEMPRARRLDASLQEHAPESLSPLWGGFLAHVDTFDAPFFGISPREAKLMDPQQRLLLEVGWEALEAAQIVPERLFNQPTGVFIGMCVAEYAHLLLHDQLHASGESQADDKLYRMTGSGLSVAAGRLAYTFGFRGPAVVVDTACSSSLVAVHQACQSLRTGECNLALAGGVNLILFDNWAPTPDDRMNAPDGRCKTFDAAADGFGRGEGCGVVVLKRLSDALADGDPILAVIRGSAVNQDGRSSGLSAPSGPSQQEVMQQALRVAGVKPEQVGYIEAHGTGTTLGDPIEIGAINALFGKRTDPLWVGSVKTNFGHLEGAAGIAGLIKLVLSLHHGEIAPHLHFQHPNPYIDWEDSPVQVPTERTPWPGGERIGGISSFGISGTNAHIVLASAPHSEDAVDA
ncbi:MAG: polyketide synthase, partial [Caldilineaceae bacterium]